MFPHLSPENGALSEPIAIIGIGCRLPGNVNTPDAFWQFLLDRKSGIGEITTERISTNYAFFPGALEEVTTRQGGFLENIDRFDAEFFGISPREARRMDPQQRLLLEVAWEALEDAGQVPEALAGSRTGVFIGLWLNDYEAHVFRDLSKLDFHMTTGSGRYAASGRLSFFLGLQGPSITIDTACSSSLVAVHLGCQSIRNGECNLAVVGGANLILQPHISVAYSRSNMIAPDGLCKFGDAAADGYVRSEGVGVVILKRLSQAIADNDSIYAVIGGSAVNNDGHRNGYLGTPSQAGQEALLRFVYESAGIDPHQVHYIEAHGSGTRVGDPVELGALATVLGSGRSAEKPCFIGSAKTNFGHTEGAAGITGLIKAALVLKHRLIPPSLHLHNANSQVAWETGRIHLVTETRPLPAKKGQGIAGVNSFGITGTNAHAILMESPLILEEEKSSEINGKAYLLPLSGYTSATLNETAQNFHTWLTTTEDASLSDICYTASCRRTHHRKRAGFVGRDKKEMLARLSAFLHDGQPTTSVADTTPAVATPKVVFVFPGQGSQWLGMGRELIAHEPVFRQTLAQCEEAMRPFVTWSLQTQLTTDPESPDYLLGEIDVLQPTLLSIEIALAALWRWWGIEPDAVIGHSMGEVAAAFVAGALSLTDAMKVICRRSQLLRRVAGQGAMVVVELSLEEVQELLAAENSDSVCLAVNNSPRMCVLAGEPLALERIEQKLQSQNVYYRRVKVDVASHSPQMDPLIPELLVGLAGIQPCSGSVPIYSTTLGIVTDGAECDAVYWAKNLRQPVLFSAMAQELIANGHNIFIEMSPHPILLPAVQQGLQYADQVGTTLSSLRRDESEQVSLLTSLERVFTLGYPVQWTSLYPQPGNFVRLPLYPWQHESYWLTTQNTTISSQTGRAPNITSPLNMYTHTAEGNYLWQGMLSFAHFPYLRDHQVQDLTIVPASFYLDTIFTAADQILQKTNFQLKQVIFQEALTLDDAQAHVVQLTITPDAPGAYSFRFYSRPDASTETKSWSLHAYGHIQQIEKDGHHNHAHTLSPPLAPYSLKPPATGIITGAAHYAAMRQRGLHYGPRFQGLAEWREVESGEIIGKLQLTTSQSVDQRGQKLHPTLLDACFQLLFATLPKYADKTRLYLPKHLASLQIYAQPKDNEPLYAQAKCHSLTPEGIVGDVLLVNSAGQLLAAAYGLHMQHIPQSTTAILPNWFYKVQWQRQPRPDREMPALTAPANWLIFADTTGLARQLVNRLHEAGATCVVVRPGTNYQQLAAKEYQINPLSIESWQEGISTIFAETKQIDHIVYLWGLTPSFTHEITPENLTASQLTCIGVAYLIRAMRKTPLYPSPRLWLITRGSQAAGKPLDVVAADQAALWGLGGGVVNECPELRCTRIDLSQQPFAGETAALLAELQHDAPVEQIALRIDGRYVARLVRYVPEMETPAAPFHQTKEVGSLPDQAYRLKINQPGLLNQLSLGATTRTVPGPDQVEIAVRTAGLNFMDVMKAMGIHPAVDPQMPAFLGGECSGIITDVGEGVVGLQAGDAVIAIAPDFDTTGLLASHVTVPAALVIPKPSHLTHEQAVTIPITFLTAYYALYYLGRLQAGERILIHAASGGVGLAAVQLAQLIGAEVLATAGSAEKRAYLQTLGIQKVMDSRTLNFAREVMAYTDGKGVDVVLNSLTGEAMYQSLAVLGTYGRFLEIGKQDIYQNTPLALRPFKNSLSFFAIDLARLIKEKPSFVMGLLQELLPLFAAGKLTPLPLKTFTIAEAEDAFRHMAQGKHIGKIVITIPAQSVTLTNTKRSMTRIRPDGSYLITGGLGGLGLKTAQWLAAQGAGTIILMSRSQPSSDKQKSIDELVHAGINVVTVAADVFQADAVASVLRQIEETLPPLRGIIHAAGILDDALLHQLDQAQFDRVAAPKIRGAWNLHTLTRHKPLDFFVLFSSAAAILGLPGQGNYLAANAFLDALAHHRRSQGLPAISINWGVWAEVGLAALDEIHSQFLAARGLGALSPMQGIAAFDWLMKRQQETQICVMAFDWQQWAASMPATTTLPFFHDLIPELTNDLSRQEDKSIRELLLIDQPQQARNTTLETYLREQVGQVLHLPTGAISADQSFKGLGIDSLMALELKNRLEKNLQMRLSTTVIFNYPTINSLATHLLDKFVPSDHTPPSQTPSVQTAIPAHSPNSPAAVSTESLDQLSDNELEALLAEEIAALEDLLKSV